MKRLAKTSLRKSCVSKGPWGKDTAISHLGKEVLGRGNSKDKDTALCPVCLRSREEANMRKNGRPEQGETQLSKA